MKTFGQISGCEGRESKIERLVKPARLIEKIFYNYYSNAEINHCVHQILCV